MIFTDKVVLITGASRGIGRATALAFAKAGATIVINCLNDREQAEVTIQAIGQLGRPSMLQLVDVADFTAVEQMVQSVIDKFGRIDVLVNNAGINMDRTAAKMEQAQWQRVIDVNLGGVFNCSHAVLPSMIQQQSGAIISVASVVAHMGNFGQTNYAASKAGIIGLTKSLAREVALKGIRVNAVAPGFIETPMLSSIPADHREKIRLQTPMGRFGRPEEVADAILFLASPQASFITGETLNVNGGVYLH